MKGRTPKPAALRQRRNRASTQATLPSQEATRRTAVAALPERSEGAGSWHPRVLTWWEAVWRSPMASEYLDSDRQRLQLIAELHQRFWTSADRGEPVTKLASEIRQQEVLFGLTPMDRRRLQWEVEKGEQAADRTASRHTRKAPEKRRSDPRDVLRLA